MPKRAKKTNLRKLTASQKKNFLSQIKWDDSYVSLIIGIIVVVIIAVLGVLFIKNNKISQTSSVQFKPTIETQIPKAEEGTTAIKANGQKIYVVKVGDSLWSISENFYKSGYNWVDIAKANNLFDPNAIFSGNKIIIPNVAPKEVTVAQASVKVMTIAGNTYTIQKGDDLWNISVRAYGDGYSWVKIAKANNLSNPDLIFSGNVLKIPR